MRNIERVFDVVNRALFRNGINYDRTIKAIGLLADLVDSAEEVDWHIGECGECTLDSLLVGAYWFCVDYHSGQDSAEYKLMCRIGCFFNPGCTSGPEPETTECDVYNELAVISGYKLASVCPVCNGACAIVSRHCDYCDSTGYAD